MRDIRRFTYTHNQKAVFLLSKTRLKRIFLSIGLLFCPQGSFLVKVLKRRKKAEEL
jgi:hypothetical protein